LDDDRSATFAISLKGIATTSPTVGATIQPSIALASAQPTD
jgi:hypothetical protein